MINRQPLLDINFLHNLDNERNRVIYARITSLTIENLPAERIEGVVTGGSIQIDGSSSVRRICNLTLTTKNLNINNIYWGLTTRVKIEIGLEKNFQFNISDNTELYEDYPDIIWFSQGIYVLTDFKTSNQINNYVITIAGKDKMCLLNGEVGGNFNATTDIGQEEIERADGTVIINKIPIHYAIREMIHHYAQERYENIIIKDIDTFALNILRNNNEAPVYIVETQRTEQYIELLTISNWASPSRTYYYKDNDEPIDFTEIDDNFHFKVMVDEDNLSLIEINTNEYASLIYYKDDDDNQIPCYILRVNKGEDIGYELTDIIYPEDLIAAPGETVTSILDKIIKQFGMYEYFYNIEGQFVFQAKQTYVNTSWNNMVTQDNESYVDPSQVRKYVQYSFEGSKLTTAYQNAPNIGQVKNDYTVWGKLKRANGSDLPIHMRYAIDIKPKFYRNFNGEIFMTPEYYTEFMNSDIVINYQSYKKHSLPEALQESDPLSWWHIEDWYEYYQAVTGSLPTASLSNYQSTNSIGYGGKLYFPNKENPELICSVEQTPSNPASNTLYLGTTPIFIFDMKDGFPVGYERDGNLNKARVAFQHRFNNCTHTLSWFLEHARLQGYESYCYQPFVPVNDTNDIEAINPFMVKQVDWREIIYQMAKDYYAHHTEDDYPMRLRKNNFIKEKNLDLFAYGKTGYEQYYHDLEAFWRLLYCPVEEMERYSEAGKIALGISQEEYYLEGKYAGWNTKVLSDPSSLIFWFDFFNAESLGLGPFSVPAIGSRPKVINNDGVKVIIYKDVPDIVYITQEEYDNYNTAKRLPTGYQYIIVDKPISTWEMKDINANQISNLFSYSTRGLTAQEEIDDAIYNFSYCNESITINSVPIYYLEPNIIISATDEQRVVNGYYILNKINIPLTYNGTMTLNAIKVPERIY